LQGLQLQAEALCDEGQESPDIDITLGERSAGRRVVDESDGLGNAAEGSFEDLVGSLLVAARQQDFDLA